MEKGLICISTQNRFEELGRFLRSFLQHNSFPVHVIIARDIKDAHKQKTLCALHSPFKYTIMMDTDILVNGDLSPLFETAKQGFIGIVREKKTPVLNSGVIVFPTELMKKVCTTWTFMFDQKRFQLKNGKAVLPNGVWDQDILNDILPQFPYKELSSEFNHILHDLSPEEENKVYGTIKVFHFLHHPNIDRNLYKSFRTYMEL
ncbi:MAG TPA: hypothetical protein VMW10_08040 [Alphaproteobacteria bacterium]|nr:hypothetical protein [Alphaproteobacteria bacterium]